MNCMQPIRRTGVAISFGFFLFVPVYLHAFKFQSPVPFGSEGNVQYELFGHFRPETFFGKNISLLNNANPNDKIWFARHTLDVSSHTTYGKATYKEPVAEFMFSIRNKAIWGNSATIAATTEAETKLLDAVGRSHKHNIPRHIFWMREVWIRFDVSTGLELSMTNPHRITIGSFPFELGRGIALGTAYAVGPENLGFYSDGAVDQYAYGASIDGQMIKDTLSYGVYAAILQNKASSLSDTGRRVLGQLYGRRDKSERGFAKVNYLVAAHLRWQLFSSA